MGVWYCTREDVKSASDTNVTARNDVAVGRAIDAASRGIEGLTHRKFYPLYATRTLAAPAYGASQIWLDANTLIAVTSALASGKAITTTLGPSDGPPYAYLTLPYYASSVVVTGLFGYSDRSDPAGTLVGALSTSQTGVVVSDGAIVGVGAILRVDDERMIVTDKRMTTSSQTLQTSLTSSNAAATVAVSNGAAFRIGETLLLDSERMLIVDIAGNNLVVKRAYDGTVLAAHSSGVTIYVARSLTVTRGAQGSTAATHADAATITQWQIPSGVRSLCIAEAQNILAQGGSAYSGESGSTDNSVPVSGGGLDAMRDQVYVHYGRKARMRSV